MWWNNIPLPSSSQVSDLEQPSLKTTGCSLLWLWDALVDIEDPGDAQPDAVQVTPDHRPQPEQSRLAGLSDLQDTGVQRKSKKDGAWLIALVPSGRTRGSGFKLKHRRFPLHIRKHFFPVRVTEPWHRLPREVVESPTLDIIKSHLDTVLGNWLWVALLEQGVGPDGPQSCLQPQLVFLWLTTAQCCPWAELELPHWQIYTHVRFTIKNDHVGSCFHTDMCEPEALQSHVASPWLTPEWCWGQRFLNFTI
ncbi:hypothetical protein QYF61_005895 [Mycteria americana]|uniref:Uncharacterized protein n=1 Tax=Mycteria americana TaxID=33587 RepID=A0AAN7MTP7_MYCAM|nr:hypothetical protein QYF61_005895 [Mycteria americana]